MGKVLRFNHFCRIIVLLLVSGHIGHNSVYAQISVSSMQSFEISFTNDETQRSRSGIRLSLQDPGITSGSLPSGNSPDRFTSSSERQNGFYFVEALGEMALGSYYHSSEEHVLSQMLFENGTSQNIGSLSVAFDFIFLLTHFEEAVDYQLSYRVNNDFWQRPAGGRFSSDFLKNDADGWGTFSIQIAIDDIYLQPGDTLELRWRARGNGGEMEFIPMALQKIELFPTRAETRSVRPGSVIISEIMPRFKSDGGYIEYVELYNSTENTVNLKGFTLSSGGERVVIQRNFYVAPYSSVVVANSSGEFRLQGENVYPYSGILLEDLSGRLNLEYDNTGLARALFEASEPGVAYRVDHLQNAYDGYSGMSHFEPVRGSQGTETAFTPGEVEESRKLFSKTISEPGWHVIQPPGRLSKDLNRDLLDTIEGLYPSSPEDQKEELSPPYLYYHSAEDEPVTLYSAGVRNIGQTASRSKSSDYFYPIGKTVSRELAVNRLVNQDGQQAFPALLGWNQAKQTFELLWHENDILKPWQAYFTPSIEDESYLENVKERENLPDDEPWTGLNRSLEFTLKTESDNPDNAPVDRALIGFWDAPANLNASHFSLPKIWSPIEKESGSARKPMIYLESPRSEYSTNSYVNFPGTPDETVQVSAGVRYDNRRDRYQISWSGLESIPDHWEVQFVDTEIDERIDMRRESTYIFFDRSEEMSEGIRDPELSFLPVESNDNKRFVIIVSPSGSLESLIEEDESPNSVELKQNYPNPFNPTTTIAFYLPKTADVKIGVYNVVGQQVGLLKDERMSAGEHTVTWNAMDMPSGVYIVQLETSNTVQTRKITLIK